MFEFDKIHLYLLGLTSFIRYYVRDSSVFFREDLNHSSSPLDNSSLHEYIYFKRLSQKYVYEDAIAGLKCMDISILPAITKLFSCMFVLITFPIAACHIRVVLLPCQRMDIFKCYNPVTIFSSSLFALTFSASKIPFSETQKHTKSWGLYCGVAR